MYQSTLTKWDWDFGPISYPAFYQKHIKKHLLAWILCILAISLSILTWYLMIVNEWGAHSFPIGGLAMYLFGASYEFQEKREGSLSVRMLKVLTELILTGLLLLVLLGGSLLALYYL